MGDPLSATASVVGIASFGISICKRVLDIYDAVRNARGDIQALCELTTALSDTFNILRNVISQSQDDTDVLKSARERIAACERGLKVLEKEIDKIRRLSTDPTMLYLRLLLRYAFKEKTIAKLKQLMVQDQMGNLKLALIALNLYCSTCMQNPSFD